MDSVTKPLVISDDILLSKIYMFRGLKVMLDKDLAELYNVSTEILIYLLNEILTASLKILCFS